MTLGTQLKQNLITQTAAKNLTTVTDSSAAKAPVVALQTDVVTFFNQVEIDIAAAINSGQVYPGVTVPMTAAFVFYQNDNGDGNNLPSFGPALINSALHPNNVVWQEFEIWANSVGLIPKLTVGMSLDGTQETVTLTIRPS